jgi:hypothetical protein
MSRADDDSGTFEIRENKHLFANICFKQRE